MAEELDPTRLRIGISPSVIEECSPEVRAAVDQGVRGLEELGVALVETELSRAGSFVDAVELIIQVEGSHEFAAWLRDESFQMSDARQLANLRSGLQVLAADYLDALRQATARAQGSFQALFSEVDFVVAASRVDGAPYLDRPRAPRDPSKQSDLLRAAGNLAAVPGVSMPCGLSSDGLPVGLQIVGPPNSEATLLRLAALYQSRTSHHERRPPEPPTNV
jgi:aspartyl-tRNA(Asn)/glutamyl-tRNA(Gln) amidotransferase subunit A